MARRNNAVPRFSLFSFQDIVTCTTGIFLLTTLLLALELAEHMEASPRVQSPKVVDQLAVEQSALDAQLAELEAELHDQIELLNSGAIIDAASLKVHVEHSQSRTEQLNREQQRLSELATRAETQKRELETKQQHRQPEKDEIQRLKEDLDSTQKKLTELQNSNRVFYNPTVGSGRTPWLVEMSHSRIVVAPAKGGGTPHTFTSTTEFLAWAGQQPAARIHLIILLKPDAVEDYDKVIDTLREQMKITVGLDVLKADQQAIDPQKGAGQP